MYQKLNDIWEAEENKKQELMEKCYTNIFPVYLQGLECVLKENNGGNGFFVGEKVTLADLSFADVSYTMVDWWSDVLKDYPKLNALKDRVESRPRIAEWMKKRPVCDL
uniref:Glutathione S-transferase-like n=1 Tax=Saccoglossus kowalevskii TaxID=10224 RepID=A0ABM0LZC1_SACKO|nr:PREDICTED: glutathione S-transferase-like [Saccoglossus kowalevskii]